MKFDIILPMYKPKIRYLSEAIDSVINQTYNNWSLIIIDDGSKDGSIENVYRNYNERKIKYIKLKKNLGPAGARNYAISKSDGEYLAFIDQDDRWGRTKLDRYKSFIISNKDVKLIHSDLDAIDENSNIISGYYTRENQDRSLIPYQKLDKNEMAENLFNYYSVRIGTLCIERKAFINSGGFDSRLFGGEDEEFIVRFAMRYNINYLPKKLTYRRLHNNNSTKLYKVRRIKGRIKSIKKMWHKYNFKNSNIMYRAYLRKLLISKNYEDEDKYKYLRELVNLNQFDVRDILIFAMYIPGIKKLVKNKFFNLYNKF